MQRLITKCRDWVFGRGEYAITIPVFDGALKPNRILEEATVVGVLDAPEDLVVGTTDMLVANGRRLEMYGADAVTTIAEFEDAITAVALMGNGRPVVAVGGRRVLIATNDAAQPAWAPVDGIEARAINALAVLADGRLALSDGSTEYDYNDWRYDLMTRGRSGRLLVADPVKGTCTVLATGLHYAFGVGAIGGRIWVSETWRHRVLSFDADGQAEVVIDELPGYPCRISSTSDGGAWLAVFAGRTQLVEFVLREPAFRTRMVAELDPEFWIAPALRSGQSFLEPLQGAGVKMRGVLKPWAPPRSYGLVVKLSSTGDAQTSFHSRLDGKHHGIVACAESDGNLYALSKGSGRLLKLSARTQAV